MSLLKLPLLLSSAVFLDIAIDRPHPLDSGDRVIVTSLRERMWRSTAQPVVWFLKGTAYLTSVAESVVILSSLSNAYRSSDTISALLSKFGPTEASRLTVPFVLGASLVITGGAIRAICFRTLGPFFTFIQCIRKDHRLITTGPYAVVRHPGYMSMFMCIVGSCFMHGSSGSWLRMSGFLSVPWVRVMATGWCLIMGASVVTLFSRTTEEDRFLAEKFGKEWENWAERVKYKFVPFIY